MTVGFDLLDLILIFSSALETPFHILTWFHFELTVKYGGRRGKNFHRRCHGGYDGLRKHLRAVRRNGDGWLLSEFPFGHNKVRSGSSAKSSENS